MKELKPIVEVHHDTRSAKRLKKESDERGFDVYPVCIRIIVNRTAITPTSKVIPFMSTKEAVNLKLDPSLNMEKDNYERALAYITEDFRFKFKNLKITRHLKMFTSPIVDAYPFYTYSIISRNLLDWRDSIEDEESEILDRISRILPFHLYIDPRGPRFNKALKDPEIFLLALKGMIEGLIDDKRHERLADIIETIDEFINVIDDLKRYANTANYNPLKFTLINWLADYSDTRNQYRSFLNEYWFKDHLGPRMLALDVAVSSIKQRFIDIFPIDLEDTAE